MGRPRWRRWIVERVGLQPLIEGDDLPGRRTSRDQLGHLPEEVLETRGTDDLDDERRNAGAGENRSRPPSHPNTRLRACDHSARSRGRLGLWLLVRSRGKTELELITSEIDHLLLEVEELRRPSRPGHPGDSSAGLPLAAKPLIELGG
jgi:hypothetical protein